jgi:hypothetical protein
MCAVIPDRRLSPFDFPNIRRLQRRRTSGVPLIRACRILLTDHLFSLDDEPAFFVKGTPLRCASQGTHNKKERIDLTTWVAEIVRRSGVGHGYVQIQVLHTTAASGKVN